MKRILLALLLACFLATPAYAKKIATFGTGSGGTYMMEADTDSVISFRADVGIKYPYEVASTSDTLKSAETGKTLLFNGTMASTFTLPTATVGSEFSFVADNNTVMRVDPQSTDTIKFSTDMAAGDKLVSSGAIMDSVTLFCGTANTWSIKAINGTWTDGN